MRVLNIEETSQIQGGFFEVFLAEQGFSLVDSALKMIILVAALGGLCYGVYGLIW